MMYTAREIGAIIKTMTDSLTYGADWETFKTDADVLDSIDLDARVIGIVATVAVLAERYNWQMNDILKGVKSMTNAGSSELQKAMYAAIIEYANAHAANAAAKA